MEQVYSCGINIIIVLGGLVLKIDNDDLEIGRTLGEGGFGEVRKGVWKPRKVDVAVKTVLTKSKFEDEVSLDQSLPTFDQSLPTFDQSLPVTLVNPCQRSVSAYFREMNTRI